MNYLLLQVILFEIDCANFYTNFHKLFCQFISWTNWVNSGKSMNNCWISCQVMKKVYDDLIIIDLYFSTFQWERHFHIAQSRWLHIYGRFHWQRRSPQFDRICEEIFSKLNFGATFWSSWLINNKRFLNWDTFTTSLSYR